MQGGLRRTPVVSALVAAASLVIHADGTPPSQAAEIVGVHLRRLLSGLE